MKVTKVEFKKISKFDNKHSTYRLVASRFYEGYYRKKWSKVIKQFIFST